MHQPSTQPSTAHDVEALADSLSACADELHQRIMQAIRKHPPGGPDPATQAARSGLPVPPAPGVAVTAAAGAGAPARNTLAANGKLEHGMSHDAAQALFEHEVALRQRANSLYVDAAALAAAGLGAPQRELLELVALARRRMRHADMLKDVIGITADMLGLAAAIAAGKPEHLPAVLESIKGRYARLGEEPDA